VFGISADSVESHKKFAEKYNLPFQLLSDPEKEILQKYGVWKEKSMYGRKFMGIERTTVIIDEKGMIKKIFPKVKVNGHINEVIEALSE
jgi:peroxiredoxin Q/BCP